MALTLHLKTREGLDIPNAVLVVFNYSKVVQEQYQLQIKQLTPRLYGPVESKANTITFQTRIFGSEQILRDGMEPIAVLRHEGAEQIQLIPNPEDVDKPALEQCYAVLRGIYPDAVDVDLTDVGIK